MKENSYLFSLNASGRLLRPRRSAEWRRASQGVCSYVWLGDSTNRFELEDSPLRVQPEIPDPLKDDTIDLTICSVDSDDEVVHESDSEVEVLAALLGSTTIAGPSSWCSSNDYFPVGYWIYGRFSADYLNTITSWFWRARDMNNAYLFNHLTRLREYIVVFRVLSALRPILHPVSISLWTRMVEAIGISNRRYTY